MRPLTVITVLGAFLASSACYAGVNLPWLAQSQKNDCGRTILASIIAWQRGGGQAEAKVAYRSLPGPANKKLSMLAMAERLIESQVAIDFLSPGEGAVLGGHRKVSDKDLKSFLGTLRTRFEAGSEQPILVPIQRRGVHHYVVLVGATNEGFRVYDPDPKLGGPEIRMTDGDLATFMRGTGGLVFVISRGG